MRVSDVDSNRVELQIAVRRFLPVHRLGPAVLLAGVSHLGERGYYQALQRQLNAASLVLYEGISAAEGTPAATQPAKRSAAAASAPATTSAGDSRSALQNSLAASLGLVFQLDAIDYTQPNFQNSDLSVRELRELMVRETSASSGQGTSQDLDGLLEFMQGDSFISTIVQAALRLLGTSPKFQGLGRLALIDLIDEVQGDPDRLSQAAPELKQLLQVLVQERNKKVIRDLKAASEGENPPASVAIFYGTAHMPDMERRLRRELGYRPAGQVWLTAFAVDLRRSGISAADRQFLDNLIGSEFKATKTKERH